MVRKLLRMSPFCRKSIQRVTFEKDSARVVTSSSLLFFAFIPQVLSVGRQFATANSIFSLFIRVAFNFKKLLRHILQSYTESIVLNNLKVFQFILFPRFCIYFSSSSELHQRQNKKIPQVEFLFLHPPKKMSTLSTGTSYFNNIIAQLSLILQTYKTTALWKSPRAIPTPQQ